MGNKDNDQNIPDELELMYPTPMKVLSVDPGKSPVVGLVEFHNGTIVGLEKIVGDGLVDEGYNYLFTTLIDGEPALMVETRWDGRPVRTVERYVPNLGDGEPTPIVLHDPALVYNRNWGSYGRYSKGVQKITVNPRKRTLH